MQHPALFIAVCYERSIMEHAHFWFQSLILLAAFIFFWREAKGSRRELKEYIREELTKIDTKFDRFEDNIWERFEKVDAEFDKVDAKFDRLEDHIREDARKVDARFDRLERILLEQGK